MIAAVTAQIAEAPAAEANRPRTATVSDIFLARLGALEERVSRELDAAAPSLGPAGEYALGLFRVAWRGASSLAAGVSTSSGRRDLLAAWTAGAPVDELGFDLELAETVREVVRPIARRWLSLGESRSSPLPERGSVLILLNRSAWPVPVEALVLWAWLGDGRLGGRPFAVMWDPSFPELPYLSDFLRRIGVVAATPENAAALLERGYVVLAFPEGAAAMTKTYDRRYRLARFDVGNVISAAIVAGAHIVPGAVAGSEDSFPLLGRLGSLPVTPLFPIFGIFGSLPLPVKWTLRLGTPVQYGGATRAASADGVADAVRARMQACLGELLGQI
jgi:1-acyl-sn-glycerol-3-phosphate acyltransferase